jgi:Asp-tRNA(Asn)/Glu-tRNA(Gln) amidotransferase A subunit family amidase
MDCPQRHRPLLLVVFLAIATPAAGQQPADAPFDVAEATVADLQVAMAAGRVTSVGLVDAYTARIRTYDPGLGTIIRMNPNARAEAALLDEERARGRVRGPLHGIPVLIKDNYDTRDMPTTGSSIALAGSRPADDATAVRRLREAGAIILAKTNLHELAAGIETVSSLGGQTRNPYSRSHNPGGSSGGTGAGVAASFAALGYGSDTCGSIRIPAVFNALFGLRPTKGLTSIDGIIPLSHTQDVIGPLARTTHDLAIGLNAVAGFDAADPATGVMQGRQPPDFVAALRPDALRGARIGVLTSYFGDAPEDREVGDLVRRALERMTQQGAVVVNVTIPDIDALLMGASVIDHEFKFDLLDYLARVPSAPVDSLGEILSRGLYHVALDAQFRRRNAAAARETDAYRAARQRQAAVRDTVLRLLQRERLDALAYPTIRRKPARTGESQRGSNCQLSAVTGFPAMAMPAGFTADSLPVGFELLGSRLDDAKLVGYAHAYEQAQRPRRPPLLPAASTTRYSAAPEPIVLTAAEGNDTNVRVQAEFSRDPAAGELRYRVRIEGMPASDVFALTLHRAAAGQNGPVLHRLSGPGTTEVSGGIMLSAAEGEDLAARRLYLSVYTAQRPLGAARYQLGPR